MLKGFLYTIEKITEANNLIEATVELNEKHEIFQGHFPNQPVLPGVCMLQMIREVLEESFNDKLQLLKADDIRFTAMIDPNESKEIKFEIQYKQVEEKSINITAKILKPDNMVCCKVKASYSLRSF